MSWYNRVAWQEGMFLRAQHFQQQDRWVEYHVRASAQALAPSPWGVTSFVIGRELLGTGRLALATASGLFDDGTPFSLPDHAPPPPPLLVPESARNVLVHLAAPIWQPGGPEIGVGADEGRYRPEGFDALDTHSGDTEPAPLQIGRLRLRYLLETDDRAGYTCLPFARIVEVTADRRVILDDGWIPPALACGGVPSLATLVMELSGMLGQRAEALAARLTATGMKSNTEVADFLLLQAVNGWRALFGHLATNGAMHPEALYRLLVQMAGELATFTEQTRRGATYPSYRHEDLQRTLTPVMADIRKSLSAVLEQTAVRLNLEQRRHNVRVAPILDRTLLTGATIVLVAKADMPAERLRREFPATAKIGAVEHIRELVNVALPGIELRPLAVAPRQMPFVPGAQYFELDRNSAHWKQMQASGGFAVHVSGNLPGLELDLWAVRN